MKIKIREDIISQKTNYFHEMFTSTNQIHTNVFKGGQMEAKL
jgi:hypothetical protein